MEKKILLILNDLPTLNLTVEKGTKIKEIKNILNKYLDKDKGESIVFFVNDSFEMPVFDTDKYDNFNLETVWDKLIKSRIIISKRKKEDKEIKEIKEEANDESFKEDLRKINDMINPDGNLNEESLNYFTNLAKKLLKYFSTKLKESKQPVTVGNIRNIILNNFPSTTEIANHARSEGDKMVGEVCNERLNVRLVKLEKLEEGLYYNYDPDKNNCESGAFLTGVIQYILEELIELAGIEDKNITMVQVRQALEEDQDLNTLISLISNIKV